MPASQRKHHHAGDLVIYYHVRGWQGDEEVFETFRSRTKAEAFASRLDDYRLDATWSERPPRGLQGVLR